MKFTEFTYTKATGEVSERAVIITSEPNKFLQGVEVSELPPEDVFGDFVDEYRKLLDRHTQERAELLAKFDLKHSYRQFDPARITNQTTEWI